MRPKSGAPRRRPKAGPETPSGWPVWVPERRRRVPPMGRTPGVPFAGSSLGAGQGAAQWGPRLRGECAGPWPRPSDRRKDSWLRHIAGSAHRSGIAPATGVGTWSSRSSLTRSGSSCARSARLQLVEDLAPAARFLGSQGPRAPVLASTEASSSVNSSCQNRWLGGRCAPSRRQELSAGFGQSTSTDFHVGEFGQELAGIVRRKYRPDGFTAASVANVEFADTRVQRLTPIGR